MTHKTRMELIDRIIKNEDSNMSYTANEAWAAVLNGYCYIKPEDTDKFFESLSRLIKKNMNKTSKMFVETKHGMPYEEWLWGMMACEAVKIAKSLFDKEYYETKRSAKVFEEKQNNKLFKDYFSEFTIDELKTLFCCIMHFTCGTLISEENLAYMFCELNMECLKLGANIPDPLTDLDRYVKFFNDKPYFFFDYLDREYMESVFCKYIDGDPDVLGYMAEALEYTAISDVAAYTTIALYMRCVFQLEVLKPIITDHSKMNIKTADLENACILDTEESEESICTTVIY